MGSNPLTHIHGDDCLDRDRVNGHLAVPDALAADVIQQHTCLVARQQLVLPSLVLDADTHTVAVWVGCQQQIGVALLGIRHTLCHSLFDLWVGVQAGRKVTVRLLLLLDHRDVGVAHFLQGAAHRLQTGAVQRAVHNGHILIDLFSKQDGGLLTCSTNAVQTSSGIYWILLFATPASKLLVLTSAKISSF